MIKLLAGLGYPEASIEDPAKYLTIKNNAEGVYFFALH